MALIIPIMFILIGVTVIRINSSTPWILYRYKNVQVKCIRIIEEMNGWCTPVYRNNISEEFISPKSFPHLIMKVGDYTVIRVDHKNRWVELTDLYETLFSVIGGIVFIVIGSIILLK